MQIRRPKTGQQISKVGSIPAPIGGLNLRDSWANMPDTDAVILDNWVPQPTWVEQRPGTLTWATFTGDCETVMAYQGLTANKLFAAVNNAGVYSIFDITAGGAAGSPVVGGAGNVVQALTSTQFDFTHFGTAVNELICVNGKDTPVGFNGTAWATITLTGTAGVPLLVCGYAGFVFYGMANTFNVYYPAVNGFSGACTLLPLAQLFLMGGSLQAIAAISVDNAGGINDYIAFISTQGEVLLFTGTNPAQASTFVLSAHFRIGRPLANGRRAFTKVGFDLACLTEDGCVMLSQAMLTERSQLNNTLTDKIRKGITDAAAANGTLFGWQLVLYPLNHKIIVNVPTAAEGSGFTAYQFVMNTLNGSWCTYGFYNSPLNAYCWEVQLDTIFFGTHGKVIQAEYLNTDDGFGITMDVQQAFSYFGSKEQLKLWKLARVVMNANAGINLTIAINTDFQTTNAPPVPLISSNTNALWNVSYWSTPTYWSQGAVLYRNWQGIGGVGFAAGLRIRLKLLNAIAQWQSTDYVYEYGGVLG
jgi:hypothetical protein